MMVERRTLLLLLFSIALFLTGIDNPECLVLGVQTILMLTIRDKRKLKVLMSAALAVILTISVKMSFLKFNFMPQARELLDVNPNLFFWFQNKHVHAIRLLISYPGYILSQFYHIPLNWGYSFYLCVIFEGMYITICNVCSKLNIKSLISIMAILVLVLGLALVMNGRIIFAFYGFSILIYAAIKQSQHNAFIHCNEIFLFFIGLLFTTVSSGCMTIGISFFTICMIIKWMYITTTREKIKIIFYVFGGGIVFYKPLNIIIRYVIFMVNKNIIYFGGGLKGLFGMLQHGLGKIFPEFSPDLYPIFLGAGILIIICNIIFLRLFFIKKYDYIAIIALAFNLSGYGIFVGFSTGSMMLVPCIVLAGIWLSHFRLIGNRCNG